MNMIRNPARSRPLSRNVKRLMKMARESPQNPDVQKSARNVTNHDRAYCEMQGSIFMAALDKGLTMAEFAPLYMTSQLAGVMDHSFSVSGRMEDDDISQLLQIPLLLESPETIVDVAVWLNNVVCGSEEPNLAVLQALQADGSEGETAVRENVYGKTRENATNKNEDGPVDELPPVDKAKAEPIEIPTDKSITVEKGTKNTEIPNSESVTTKSTEAQSTTLSTEPESATALSPILLPEYAIPTEDQLTDDYEYAYWLGYIYRFECFLHDESSRMVYGAFPEDFMKQTYDQMFADGAGDNLSLADCAGEICSRLDAILIGK